MSSFQRNSRLAPPDPRFPRVLVRPEQMSKVLPGISPERIREAEEVASTYTFRVPDFYARHVLNGNEEDPLLDLILPSKDEYLDGNEQWDATPSRYAASKSHFWVQKYEYQGLVRTTTHCSGLCRYCYLKRKNEAALAMRPRDVEALFDDLEVGGKALREIILSGGDPLAAPPETLSAIASRLDRMRSASGRPLPHVVIHTREPVWDPVRLLRKEPLWTAMEQLRPKAIMLHVLHPREVTAEFLEVCARLAEICNTNRPVLFCQHPVFRGVNDSPEILEELYALLIDASPAILPYYFVHPFYNGTLARHKMSLEDSQLIFQELVRRPGWFAPRLVVPTPWGKCLIGPHEELKRNGTSFELTTKDGLKVLYDNDQTKMRLLSYCQESRFTRTYPSSLGSAI